MLKDALKKQDFSEDVDLLARAASIVRRHFGPERF